MLGVFLHVDRLLVDANAAERRKFSCNASDSEYGAQVVHLQHIVTNVTQLLRDTCVDATSVHRRAVWMCLWMAQLHVWVFDAHAPFRACDIAYVRRSSHDSIYATIRDCMRAISSIRIDTDIPDGGDAEDENDAGPRRPPVESTGLAWRSITHNMVCMFDGVLTCLVPPSRAFFVDAHALHWLVGEPQQTYEASVYMRVFADASRTTLEYIQLSASNDASHRGTIDAKITRREKESGCVDVPLGDMDATCDTADDTDAIKQGEDDDDAAKIGEELLIREAGDQKRLKKDKGDEKEEKATAHIDGEGKHEGKHEKRDDERVSEEDDDDTEGDAFGVSEALSSLLQHIPKDATDPKDSTTRFHLTSTRYDFPDFGDLAPALNLPKCDPRKRPQHARSHRLSSLKVKP